LHFLAVFLVYLLFCFLARYDALAGTPAPDPLAARLSGRLTRPTVLNKQPGNAVVVVQFRIAECGRLTDLRVHTADRDLHQELTRQLYGIRLKHPAGDTTQVHTVRLRFRR
jgi:hypothetical protein